MRINYFPFLVLTCILFCIQTHGQDSYSKDVQQQIKAVEHSLSSWVVLEGAPKWTIQERMKYYHVQGVSVAVIRNYKIQWTKGYGWADSAENRPVTPQTLFQAGSISKSLNGVGLLTLVQNKKVDLYTDVNRYLRTWKFPYDSVAHGKTINLANLLSHTAGLSVHGFPGYERGDTIPTLPQILDGKLPANTEAVRSLFAPGLKFQYAGGGTTISQLLLMDVTRQPYDKYMWEQVLKPLEMTNSTYTQPLHPTNPKKYATAYYEDGKEVNGKYHIYPEQAAAGLWTNPTDLSKYIIETQLSLAGKSSKVLTPEMTKLRLTPYVDSAAALGVFIMEKDGTKYFSHNGQDEGFTATYYGSFDGNGVVVMSNSNTGAVNNEVVNAVASVYKWKALMPVPKMTVSLPDTTLAKYIGVYTIANDTLTIGQKDNDLIIGIKGTPIAWKMYFTSPDSFFLMDLKGEFFIEHMDRNKVRQMALQQGSARTKIERVQ